MSFDIVLQKNLSENNKVGKDITDIITLSGTLKENCSLIDPVILIECSSTNIVQCNYMTIAEFGRKYFINNITSIRNGLYQIAAHVDVLDTYSTQIKNLSAIVKRQQNEFNLYLNDGSFKVYQDDIVLTKSFSGGFSNPSFILAVAGG